MNKPNPKIFTMSFASVYILYIVKVEKKGRTKQEVDEAIMWLTGYDAKSLQKQIDNKVSFVIFFTEAPQLNPNVDKITGSICGYKIQEIADPLMKKIRYMDKLIDEIAKGRPMEKILRK
jgi:hypothetical protein